ncbi:MAG: peptidoglycan DD-metalloendopeptidase family protein [Myxococcales bacterium]|nr:peptidoglycan DD-metalloendopeptidase family protein [Myxococcales bacterium]
MLGVLVLVNLYVFVWRDGTSIGDVRAKAQNIGAVPIDTAPPAPPAPVAAELAAGPRVVAGKVAKGESLGKILRGAKGADLSAAAADELIRAVGPVFDLRGLRDGQAYTIKIDEHGVVQSFELVVSKTVTVRVVRDADGVLGTVKDEAATRIETKEIGGDITSSLYASVKAAGEDGALVSFFVDVFAYDVDFYNDTRAGDTFKVIVEKEYKDQEFLRYRRILAAEYSGKNAGTYRAFYWQAGDDKPGRYYDETGQSVEKSMLKTPLKFARVSSGFNPKRMHPVLHRVKGHFGTDFACPVGTPVWAAADGVITQRGPHGGAGNMLTIRHANGLVTIYMHLSKFVSGFDVGSRVSAKTVVAYSGNTGLSTGPHLHFGVKLNGAWTDFQSLKPARAAGVPKALLPRFKDEVGQAVARLAEISTAATPALASDAPAAAPTL